MLAKITLANRTHVFVMLNQRIKFLLIWRIGIHFILTTKDLALLINAFKVIFLSKYTSSWNILTWISSRQNALLQATFGWDFSSDRYKSLFSQEQIQMVSLLNAVEVIRRDSRGTIKMVSVVVALAKHHSIPTSMNAVQMDPSRVWANVAQQHHHRHRTNVHV